MSSVAVAQRSVGIWIRDGLCSSHAHPHWWKGISSETTIEAIKVCRRCPVKEECLAFALETQQNGSIWGGLTPKERRALAGAQRRENARARDRSNLLRLPRLRRA